LRRDAGVFSAHAALPFYAMAFEKAVGLDQCLFRFTSRSSSPKALHMVSLTNPPHEGSMNA
jgi:dihydroorotase